MNLKRRLRCTTFGEVIAHLSQAYRTGGHIATRSLLIFDSLEQAEAVLSGFPNILSTSGVFAVSPSGGYTDFRAVMLVSLLP
jgi:hypothetical protein